MKAAQYKTRGVPSEVVEVVDLDEPRPLNPGQARVAVLASPINPSDLLMLSGHYAILPTLPAIGGSEGVGRVLEVAPTAEANAGPDLPAVGQLVGLPIGTPAWQSQVVVKAAELTVLPDNVDPQQLCMLAVNPPTALLMLEHIVSLQRGDWVVQNAANSGVGTYVIELARAKGLRTVNVVRRAELADSLTALGADVVVVDGPDLGERVHKLTAGGARLGIDAVGGEATQRIAQSLANGGTVVNYGVLSGQSCQVSPVDLIFRNIHLQGFWVAKWYMSATAKERADVYGRLAALIADGTLHTAIEKTYPVEEARAAIAHAMRTGRAGKILITPNPGA